MGVGRWREFLQSVEMAHSLRRWSNEKGTHYAHFVLRIVIKVVVGVRERNDPWISLVVDEFGVPVTAQVLRANINHGDSLSLLFLLDLHHSPSHSLRFLDAVHSTVASLTKFDIRNTLPELQHEFCDLWNEIVQNAWRAASGPDSTALKILREIRHAYYIGFLLRPHPFLPPRSSAATVVSNLQHP